MIKAECHSDDHNVEVNFDATTWFKQASDKDILDLDGCGWGGDYPADEVAEFIGNHNKRIAEMFRYLEIVRDQGFECNVDEASARKWLKKNRPVIEKLIA